jgi:hypothetical protein
VPIKLELKGLRELQTSLARVAPETKREFQNELKTIGKMVADDTRASMEFKRPTGRAKRSVKVKIVTRRGFEGVQISEGGGVAPYTPWLDFGGTVGKGRRSTARVTLHGGGRVSVRRIGSQGSGSVVRPYIKDGRYLYPAYYRRYDDMVAATLDAVRKAAATAGLEVKTS